MQSKTIVDPQAWPGSVYLTSADIEHHMARGRRLRSEAIVAAFRSLGHGLLKSARAATRPGSGGQVRSTDMDTAVRSPLAAIRSSAETLRDNPDLSPAQRARFVEILIAEEQRLERVLAGAFGTRADLPGG